MKVYLRSTVVYKRGVLLHDKTEDFARLVELHRAGQCKKAEKDPEVYIL
jgi:hypothetical protein